MAKELVQLELGVDFEREGATAKNLQATLEELQKNFKLKLNIDIANDTGTMDKLVKKVEEVSKAIQKTNEEGGFEKTTEEALKLQEVLNGMKTLKVSQVFDGNMNLQQTKTTLQDIDGVIKQIKSDAKNNITQIVETDNVEKQEQAIRKQAEAIAKAKEKMDDYKRGLQSKLDVGQKNGLLNASILDNLQKRLDKLNVDSPKRSIETLDNAINNLSKSETRIVALQKAIDKAKQALSNAKLSDAFNDTKSIEQFENAIKQAQGSMMNRLKKNSQSVTNFDFSSTIDELKQFTSQFNTTVSKNETYILRLEKSLTELQTRFREISSDSKAMKMDGVKESLQSIETEIVKTTELMDNLTNGKAYKGTDIDRQIMNNNNSLKEMKSTLKSTTSEVTSFSDKVLKIFGNVGIYTSAYEIINKVGREFKNAVEYVTQLDDAMTNLKKVLGDTESISSSFMGSMHDLAMNMGTQSDKAVEAVEMWKKAGESLGDSQTLAKTTLMANLVGDVGDVETAQQYLIAPMKAFNKDANETIQIVDQLNKLSNEMATDFNEIGDGLSRSASVMSVAGNSLEQTTALIATLEATTKVGGARIGNASCQNRAVYVE